MTVRDFERFPAGHLTMDAGLFTPTQTGLAHSFAFVWKCGGASNQGFIAFRNAGGGQQYGMNPFGNESVFVTRGGFTSTSYADQIGQWSICGVSVPAYAGSGVTPRFHLYDFGTDTWDHVNASGTVNDLAGDVTIANIRIGRYADTEYLDALLAAGGVYHANLSDADFETMPAGIQAMLDLDPVALWAFNQDSVEDPVLDLTDNGHDQTAITGTAVVTDDDPPGFDFELGGEPEPEPEPEPTSHTDLWEWLWAAEREGVL